MKLDDFINAHNVQLDSITYLACRDGIDIMKLGSDPHHSGEHIDNILSHLNDLLISNPIIVKKIDFAVLLPAICWHDVWISGHLAQNILHLTYLQIVEGRGSASMWHKYSNGKLQANQAKKIGYCIRKHSSLQILPTIRYDAKVLIDLDKLELWNVHRFIDKKKTLVSQKQLYSKYIVRLYLQYSWHAGLYFRELNRKFYNLRNNFFSELN